MKNGFGCTQAKRKKIPKEGREGGRARLRPTKGGHWISPANGRKGRQANLKDDCTRECPAIEVDFSLPSERVVELLNRVALSAATRIFWSLITVLNSEVVPLMPTQNAYIESFNGRFRHECLNQLWFTSIGEAREIIESRRIDYNTERPHSSLKYKPPEEFAAARPFDKTQ